MMNEFQTAYYGRVRHDLLSLIPQDFKNLCSLEIGCGAGNTSEYLKTTGVAKRIVGVELNKEMASLASKRMDKVVNLSVENPDLPFKEHEFDLLILADVIEHLHDPWETLGRLRRYLKLNGYMLISIPNVQHWRNILNLIRGRWDYQDAGMLDRTHLRFFTRRTIKQLIEQAGMKILKVKCSSGPEALLLNKITFGLFSNILTYHYFLLVKKSEIN